MGNYITTEDLKLRVGTDRFNAFCTDDPENIPLTVIAHAEGLVDGFASVRYEVPMEVTPLLQEWCLNAAEYELYKLSPNSKMPEKIRFPLETEESHWVRDLRDFSIIDPPLQAQP